MALENRYRDRRFDLYDFLPITFSRFNKREKEEGEGRERVTLFQAKDKL